MNENLRRIVTFILSFLSWFFGVWFVLLGIILLFSPMGSSGLFFVIMGTALLPPVTKLVRNRFNFRLSAKVKTVVLLVCFILAVATTPKTEQSKVAEPSPSPSPVQRVVKSPPSASPVQRAVEPTPKPSFVQKTVQTPKPSPVQRPIESAPKPSPVQKAVEPTPKPLPVQRPVEPAPKPSPVQKPVELAPKPLPNREAVAPLPSPSPAQSANLPACIKLDCDCKDFATQEEAQRVFDAYSGDPYRLDKDKDGIACETN